MDPWPQWTVASLLRACCGLRLVGFVVRHLIRKPPRCVAQSEGEPRAGFTPLEGCQLRQPMGVGGGNAEGQSEPVRMGRHCWLHERLKTVEAMFPERPTSGRPGQPQRAVLAAGSRPA